MAEAMNVAAAVRAAYGPAPLSWWKLHKLLYFCQGWSIAWRERPLFAERIEAWKDGPVVREVYRAGNANSISAEDRAIVDTVVSFYGTYSTKDLIELTHREPPWRIARRGTPVSGVSSAEITRDALRAHFQMLKGPTDRVIPAGLRRTVDILLSIPEDEVDRLGEDAGIDFDAEVAYLKGQGPDQRAQPTEIMIMKAGTDNRLANTVLYLLQGRPDAGLTVLQKLLYFSDYEHYQKHLTTITGATYVVRDRGPVLKDYQDQLKELERRGLLRIKKVPVVGHEKPKEEYERLGEADPKAFKSEERETLDYVLMACDGKYGVELSAQSHAETGPWKLAGGKQALGADIPHALFRWHENYADESDVATARERSKRPPTQSEIRKLIANMELMLDQYPTELQALTARVSGAQAAVDHFVEALRAGGANLPMRAVDSNSSVHDVDNPDEGRQGRERFCIQIVRSEKPDGSVTFTLIDIWERVRDLSD